MCAKCNAYHSLTIQVQCKDKLHPLRLLMMQLIVKLHDESNLQELS